MDTDGGEDDVMMEKTVMAYGVPYRRNGGDVCWKSAMWFVRCVNSGLLTPAAPPQLCAPSPLLVECFHSSERDSHLGFLD
jgi:hypothetical protein